MTIKKGLEIPYLADSYELSGKPLVNDSNFLFNLKNFFKDGINDETIELLHPYIG